MSKKSILRSVKHDPAFNVLFLTEKTHNFVNSQKPPLMIEKCPVEVNYDVYAKAGLTQVFANHTWIARGNYILYTIKHSL